MSSSCGRLLNHEPIYSRLDGVVAWKACIDHNPHNNVEHVEVEAGHAELGFSSRVFRIVAQSLSE